MKIYGLKNCDTCRKAAKALGGAELHDVRAGGFPKGLLEAAEAKFGNAILNTRSTTWRSLSEGERQGEPADLIAAHPALMKRPLIEAEGQLHLGWTKDVQAALGL